ncbi:MAG: SBBP repeat-containing protein [Bacteroidota bacterium]
MKNVFLIALFSSWIVFSFGQNPDWLWANSAGGSDYDFANSVCTDRDGNVYITGNFNSPSVTFGNYTLNNATGYPYDDIFFAKYDANGNVLWAKSVGGYRSDKGYSCATDAYGYVYLMGYFDYLDTLVLGNDTLFNYSMFLAKYDSSGNEIWARETDAGYPARAYGICLDSLGYIYLTGIFNDSASFSGHVIYGSTEDIFLVKYDMNGNVIWVRSAGGTNNQEEGIACATDNKGNIYITGIFTNFNMYIGTDTLTNFNPTPCVDTFYCPDIFIARYDTAGNFHWAKSAGGNDFDYPQTMVTDANGNIFIAGSFISSSITFGAYLLNNVFQGQDYTYVAKYDSLGNVLWADAPVNSPYYNGCRSMAVDSGGNIFLAGYFGGYSITFGSITLSRTYWNGSDLYVVKYNATGAAVWAARAGSPYTNTDAYGIAITPNSDIYVTGSFHDTIPVQFGNINVSGFGRSDIFLAKVGTVLGIEENITYTDLNIFPNPTNGNVHILCSTNIDEIKITDVLGQVIKQVRVNENYSLLYVNEPGIYFISVTSANRVTTKKLIVTK